MGKVKLMDCTLGSGGELIGGAFGEDALYQIRPLLQKSGIDILELGVLCSHTKGPHHAIYTTTELPPVMERLEGQSYAMLLDENRPDLSALPDRSEQTVDVLRVPLTMERIAEDMKYCTRLREKGYQVAVLVMETARYGEKELEDLLHKVGNAKIWACYIYDSSGLMDCKELEKTFACFDRSLPPDVYIGFHCSDSLWLAFDLAQAFCTKNTERLRLLDASVGGLGCGALQLQSGKITHWMNRKTGTCYYVPVLQYCRDFLMPHLTPKKSDYMRLAYRAAAEHRCTYRYAEYLCGLDIPCADQMDVFSEIAEKDRLAFSRRAANQALVRYRKKRLNMVLIVPTANRAKAVDSFLFTASRDLLRFGIDVVIYDSSDDERTRAVTANFQLEDFVNIHYERYTGGFDGISLDEKVMTAYREHLDYDYIWVCRDGTIPLIGSCYHELLWAVDHGADWIAIDSIYRNEMRWRLKKYDNCVDFFSENSARLSILGASIYKSSFIQEGLETQPLSEINQGFWQPFAPLHQLAKKAYIAILIIANTGTFNAGSPPKSFWNASLLAAYAGYWYDGVKNLPDVYESAKKAALPIEMSDFHPFHLKSMLSLRAGGGFSLSTYKKYKNRLSQMSDTPPWKFYLAALIPKPLARLLLKIDGRATAKPEARLSKLHRKLFDVYVRLGR